MTKFVGKFRKNQDYSDDYKTMNKREKLRNEHGEIKKVLSRDVEKFDEQVIMQDEYYDLE